MSSTAAAGKDQMKESGAATSKQGDKNSAFRERYQLKGVLGNGNYSVVREAVDKKTGDHVAVKCIDKKKLTAEDEEALKIEVGVLSEISHANIIDMYGFFEESKNYYIVTEYMQGGELFDRIVKKEYYSEKDAQEVVKLLGSAIKYCHDRGIVHRDLKPENILMKNEKEDSEVKIADFGFARKEQSGGLTTACGTPGYVAPEIITNSKYDRAVDMWSLGVIIYILLCGYPPFYNSNQAQLFQQIRNGQFEYDDPYWTDISQSAKDMISGLLTVDPKKRLTVDQMLSHPWVQASVEDKDLTPALSELKKFNARRKIRAGAKAALAAAAFSNMVKKIGEAAAELDAESEKEKEKEAEKATEAEAAETLSNE